LTILSVFGGGKHRLFRLGAGEEFDKTDGILPETITARYVRIVIETTAPSTCPALKLKAAVLLHTAEVDMFVGKHEFRRCLESDRYLKLVNVGKLTLTTSQALNQSTPQSVTKSVECPGCYQCREVPIAPWTGGGTMRTQQYSRLGFEVRIADAGKNEAVVTISLRSSIAIPTWGQTWDTWDPELMCRINPNSDAGNDVYVVFGVDFPQFCSCLEPSPLATR
jgi:hypothetical protein